VISAESQRIADAGRRIYEERLKSALEPVHRDEFVAIQPQSGDYFLGRTLAEAIRAARHAYPDRLTHVMRVGHPAERPDDEDDFPHDPRRACG
jgi:hypothetical protein